MRKGYKHKSPESAAREKMHQFGQPLGNKPCPTAEAVAMRDFYRWVESKATEQELRDYVANQDNPLVRRKFVQAMTSANTPQDFFDLTNQTHGQPKQVIEQTNLPAIKITLE